MFSCHSTFCRLKKITRPQPPANAVSDDIVSSPFSTRPGSNPDSLCEHLLRLNRLTGRDQRFEKSSVCRWERRHKCTEKVFCPRRVSVTAARTCLRRKHIPLFFSLSLDILLFIYQPVFFFCSSPGSAASTCRGIGKKMKRKEGGGVGGGGEQNNNTAPS